MSISARRAHVISVAQTRAATRLLDIVTLTLITITFTLTPFTLTPPLALLILLFDAPCEHTRVLHHAPADFLREVGRPGSLVLLYPTGTGTRVGLGCFQQF